MKITLNLATRPYADQGPAIKQLRIGMGILAGLLVLLGLGLMHFHQSALNMAAREAQIERQVNQIQREQLGYRQQMQQPANARVLQQAQFLNNLFDEKSFSWTGAMEDLEQVLPAGVQVTSIEPSRGKDGRITLHLRVSGPRERAVEMLRNMERSRRFAAPRISGENAENNSQNGFQPVRDTGPGKVSFDVLAEYSPATLEERRTATAAIRRTNPNAGERERAEAQARRSEEAAPQPLTTPAPAPTPARPPRRNESGRPGQGQFIRPPQPNNPYPMPGATPQPTQENPQ